MVRDTHVTLFHFTAAEHWPAIRTAGTIQLSAPVGVLVKGQGKTHVPRIVLPALVWLTSTADPAKQDEWARAMPQYRAAVRIRVRVPLFAVKRLVDVARLLPLPPELYAFYKSKGPMGEYGYWYLCKRAIPMAEWLRAELVSEGITLWRPEAARVKAEAVLR